LYLDKRYASKSEIHKREKYVRVTAILIATSTVGDRLWAPEDVAYKCVIDLDWLT